MRYPANLTDENARKLWKATVDKYDLETHELLLLEQACRELALIDRMEDDIQALKKLTVNGSMGQPVISEHVKEIRQHRSEFTRLIKSLCLPADDAGAASPRSVQARAAANERWRVRAG